MKSEDVSLIVNYWMQSPPEFLIGMGVDLEKMPIKEALTEMLKTQTKNALDKKSSYALIWEIDGVPVGHSNVNNIKYAESAKMHLHLWYETNRKSGVGLQLLKKSLPFYFDKLQLDTLICEPYAKNIAPNKTLAKVGFKFVKKYVTIPGSLNFEQEVNRWELTKDTFMTIKTTV
jgi:RimJ/RimL family protein N-acetyltransferase